MNYYLFCPRWNPREIPPPPLDQFNDNARNTWQPADCRYTYRENELPDNMIRGALEYTAAGAARFARCTTHNVRPRAYVRSWTAERHRRDAMDNNYRRITTRVSRIEGFADRFRAYRDYPDMGQWYWELVRPPAITTHALWRHS